MGDRSHNRHGPKRGAAGTPSNAMWPVPMTTSVQSGVLNHPAVWLQYTWAKNWVGVGVPIEHNVAQADAYLHTSGILIHAAVWPQ